MASKSEIIEFGMKIINYLQSDEKYSFEDDELKLYFEGLTADDPQLTKFINDANKVYHNVKDEELIGNYLVYEEKVPDGEIVIKPIVRINLDAYYDESQIKGFVSVAQNIAHDIIEQKENSNIFSETVGDSLTNYEAAREKLIIRMLNYRRNYVRLENAIYDRVGDMAVCAYMIVSNDFKCGGESMFSTTKITEGLAETYGVSHEQIIKDAFENCQKLYPARFFFSIFEIDGVYKGASLEDTMRMLKSGEKKLDPQRPMLELTTTKQINGACAFFYPGMMEKISEMLGGDYYAVFTSINEVMLHPRSSVTPRSLKDSLLAVNQNFSESDILTDYVYRYDSQKKRIREV